MLFLRKTMMLPILCLTVAAAQAQNENAPSVFKQFSSTISLDKSELDNAMLVTKGQQTELSFGEGLRFSGEVLSNINVFDNLQTVIIKSSSYNNAVIQVSRQINTDKTVNYVGRIFSPGAADGFEIKRSADGVYRLQKFETAVLLQDCNMK